MMVIFTKLDKLIEGQQPAEITKLLEMYFNDQINLEKMNRIAYDLNSIATVSN